MMEKELATNNNGRKNETKVFYSIKMRVDKRKRRQQDKNYGRSCHNIRNKHNNRTIWSILIILVGLLSVALSMIFILCYLSRNYIVLYVL